MTKPARPLSALLATTLAAALCAAAFAAPSEPGAKWKPVQADAQWISSPKGKGAVAVRFAVAPGWEITSDSPIDADAFPCGLTLRSKGIRFAAPKWPEPSRTPIPELGFDKLWFGGKFEAVVPAKAIGAYDTAATTGVFRYQACQGKMCLAPDSVSVAF